MSDQLWQEVITDLGTDLIAAGSIGTPNKVVLQNLSPRFTIYVAAGVGVTSAPNQGYAGLAGANGTSSNAIALPPGATSPVINLVSGAGLWAVSDADHGQGWNAGLNIIQEVA